MIKEIILLDRSSNFYNKFILERSSIEQRLKDAEDALARWEENDAKRRAFEEKAREMGYDPSDKMSRIYAKRKLKNDPAYDYDQRILLASKDSLVAKIEKLKQEYSKYDPSYSEYEYEAGKKKTSSIAPEEDKTRFKIGDFEPMKWIPWTKNIGEESSKPFGSTYSRSSSKDKSKLSGVGPGEEWLAYLFGGRIQGTSSSYDIVLPDGSTWEVKSIRSKGDKMRTGVEGKKVYSKASQRLRSVMDQIGNFLNVIEDKKISVGQVEDKKIKYVKDFYDHEYDMIVNKEEVSGTRILKIKGVLDILGGLKKISKSSEDKKINVDIGSKTYAVSLRSFIKISKEVDPTLLDDIDPYMEALSELEDDAFMNADHFMSSWLDSIGVEEIFSKVTGGVFVVTEKSFLIVPKDQIKNVFTFSSITMGRPTLHLTSAV